jgi:Flp pilus assembly protein CpaB
VDARVGSPIYEGEVVRRARLVPGTLSTVAARLPPGTRAVAVPLDPGLAPPLAVGDRVDILVALAGEAASGGPPGFAVATDVEVVHATDQAATLAVPRDRAPRVAVALGQGAVSLALVGGEEP